MSFLTKAVKAAATAKSQIDDVRELRADTAVKPVPAGPPSDHEREILERARRIGAVDPSLLLTAAEACEAAGREVGGPHLTYGDDFLGVRFEAAGPGHRHWRVTVSAFHATDEHVHFDAAAHWFGFLADVVSDDGVAVAGLGDVAIQREHDLYVLADPLLLMVEVATPEAAGDADRAVQLARRVVARLLG